MSSSDEAKAETPEPNMPWLTACFLLLASSVVIWNSFGFSMAPGNAMLQLHYDEVQWSNLLNVGSYMMWTFVLLVSGELVDACHRPRLLAISSLGCSMLNLIQPSIATSYGGMLADMVLRSILFSPFISAVTSYALSITPQKYTSTMMGIIYSNTGLATSLALGLNVAFGKQWLNQSYVGGSLGLALGLAFLGLPEAERTSHSGHVAEAPAMLLRIYRHFFRVVTATPALPLACAIVIATDANQAAAQSMQQWLVLEHHLDADYASKMTSILTLVVGVPGYILSGMLADYLSDHHGVPPLVTCAVLQSIDVSCGIVSLYIPSNTGAFWVCQAFAFAASNNFIAPFLGVLGRMIPPEFSGSTIALIAGVGGIATAIFAQAFGHISNGLIVAHSSAPFTPIMLAGAVTAGLAVPLLLVLNGRYDRDCRVIQAICKEFQQETLRSKNESQPLHAQGPHAV
jgi:hypothetical protein